MSSTREKLQAHSHSYQQVFEVQIVLSLTLAKLDLQKEKHVDLLKQTVYPIQNTKFQIEEHHILTMFLDKIKIYRRRLEERKFLHYALNTLSPTIMQFSLSSKQATEEKENTLIRLPLSSSSCNAVFSSRQVPISRNDSENSANAI